MRFLAGVLRAAVVGVLSGYLAVSPGTAAAGGPTEIQVSATTDLTEGQRITVSGRGFQAGLAAVAVGMCKQDFRNGLKDCDLDGGATFVNIGGDGTFGPLTLTVHHRFHDIDCTEQQCVIAAAPLPGTEPPAIIAANSAAVSVNFAGSRLSAATPAPVSTATVHIDADTEGPSTVLWAVTAGLLVLVAGFALADRRRL
ncbi:neocarzinostatin apoprotein domain-containing protein [Nocardia sp. NPDC006044]|uniref:neocarzinostatin apoprotein domain-containing protein n=1 Tax=Nocardia sp. NPDC006044 TaxID=3364306 RepID=UPI003675E2CA